MGIDQIVNDNYAIYNDDCMNVMKNLPDNKVHFTIYSPPFGGLYNYSSDDRDLSNCADYDEFLEHYKYVVQEIYRLTVPGRLTAVHCADVPLSNTGKDFMKDLPGDIIRLHESIGFGYVSRHTIWKEPLWVRNRTMAKQLAHKTVVDNAAFGGVASADYLLMFRKGNSELSPVENPVGLSHYAGACEMPEDIKALKGFSGDQKQNRYSHWIWRRYASSIWDDIDMARVLPFQDSKDEDDERHVHPLQLDVIDRAITLRTNIGDTVLTPFMGVGSEVYVSVTLGRKGIGAELKPSYFKQAVLNLKEAKLNEVTLYDDNQMKLFEKV